MAHGVLARDGDLISLTDRGRELAQAVVDRQEAAVAARWSGAGGSAAVTLAGEACAELVERARGIAPPASPDAFALFVRAVDRPSAAARLLRLITSMRYWRADAHRAALAAAGLEPTEAHALNRLWDAHRGVDRVGQGRAEPGKRGLAALDARGLARDGLITPEGISCREAVEADTDVRTDPLYDILDKPGRTRLLSAMRALPT